MHDSQGIPPRLALDVDRAAARGEGSDQGPVPHVGLGHETAVPGRIHDQDVKPGDVIGHQQHRPGGRRLAAQLEPNAQHGEHLEGPVLNPGITLPRAQAREYEQDARQPRQDVKKPPCPPPSRLAERCSAFWYVSRCWR